MAKVLPDTGQPCSIPEVVGDTLSSQPVGARTHIHTHSSKFPTDLASRQRARKCSNAAAGRRSRGGGRRNRNANLTTQALLDRGVETAALEALANDDEEFLVLMDAVL